MMLLGKERGDRRRGSNANTKRIIWRGRMMMLMMMMRVSSPDDEFGLLLQGLRGWKVGRFVGGRHL